MARPRSPRDEGFGGAWTKEKLDVLQRYLDAYTTALKNQPFQLWYIDAFAGTGDVQLRAPEDDTEEFLAGSARRALEVRARPFDRLIFIEKDPRRCSRLECLRSEYPRSTVQVENAEANSYLMGLCPASGVRGVLFLDPFATQVAMSTLTHVASLECLDTWILFPASAVARLLPRSRQPDDISATWVKRLDLVYGGDSWRDLYRPEPQQEIWGSAGTTRTADVSGPIRVYRERLSEIFGERLLVESAKLRNSRGSVLFELLFCVGHSNGIGPAKNIAAHLLKNI